MDAEDDKWLSDGKKDTEAKVLNAIAGARKGTDIAYNGKAAGRSRVAAGRTRWTETTGKTEECRETEEAVRQVGASRSYDVVEVMSTRMGVDFTYEIQEYVDDCTEHLWLYDRLNGYRRLLVQNCCRIDTCIPAVQNLWDIRVGMLFSADVLATDDSQADAIEVETVYFVVNSSLDLRPCDGGCKGLQIVAVPPRLVEESRNACGKLQLDVVLGIEQRYAELLKADMCLVPIMSEADYDHEALNFLRAFYPEAVHEAYPVDGEIVASRMGAKIVYGKLRPEIRKFGFTCFCATTVDILDEQTGRYISVRVLPGTIVINTRRCTTYEQRNSTILHECTHFWYHRNFYMLQMSAGASSGICAQDTEVMSEGSKREASGRLSAVDWTELQAQKFPAHVLMPVTTAVLKANVFFMRNHNQKDIDTVRRAITYLSNLYRVSFAMAKYRMVEFGFNEAEGICEYVDGEVVPDHGCTYSWPEGATFVIDAKDTARLLSTDRDFVNLLKSGAYTYAEGHFCFRNPKYLHYDSKGRYVLTQYAREHIEECCLSFQMRGRTGGAVYEPSMVSKNEKTPVKNR